MYVTHAIYTTPFKAYWVFRYCKISACLESSFKFVLILVLFHFEKEVFPCVNTSCRASYPYGIYVVVWGETLARWVRHISRHDQLGRSHSYVLLLCRLSPWSTISPSDLVEEVPNHIPNGTLTFRAYPVEIFLFSSDSVCSGCRSHAQHCSPSSYLCLSNFV